MGYNSTGDGYSFIAVGNPPSAALVTGCAGQTPLNKNDLVDVSAATLAAFPPDRWGWSYGALAVPFKFELNHKHDLQASATLGPYFGYLFDNVSNGFSVTPLIFLGPTIFNNTTTSGSSGAGFGISGGGGVLFKVKGDFQLGLVAGYDRTSSGSGYLFNSRWWISATVGYPFN